MARYVDFGLQGAPATSLFNLSITGLNITSSSPTLMVISGPADFEIRIAGTNLSITPVQQPNGSFTFETGGEITAVAKTSIGGGIVYESVTEIPNIPFKQPSTNDLSVLIQQTFAGPDTFQGGAKDDTFFAFGGNDTFDGAAGQDTVIFSGPKANYTVRQNANGSFTVTDSVANRDGTDTLVGIERLQFSDQIAPVEDGTPFPALFAVNLSQGKAIAAAYQILLGGTPGIAGFEFLIKGNLSTNFGAGAGPVFNDENIFINVANSLVQGNPIASAQFNSLASGATLAEQVASLYAKIIPLAKQTADGLAYLTRPDGLKFYQDVAKERGITAENGPAVVAMASLLKVAVDGKNGIGNPISDLIASIADGSSELPATSQSVLPIETIDGTKFDADDAPDVMPGFSGPTPAPVPLVGVDIMSLMEPAGL